MPAACVLKKRVKNPTAQTPYSLCLALPDLEIHKYLIPIIPPLECRRTWGVFTFSPLRIDQGESPANLIQQLNHLRCQLNHNSSVGAESKKVGGGPQDWPTFQMRSMTQKSVQTCSIYSPDHGEYN